MLNTLDHTNLPKVIDYFLEKDRYYLVMDYIKGRTVKDYIENNSADMETVEKIMYQLCDILEYLHGQHIIFRDLKPSNIMILPDFKIKLIDFGIARIFKDSKQYDTVIVGTPGFCPPEQYGRGQTDERSDIYSLGANLYYMLTGKVPDLPEGRKEIENNGKLTRI
jgi:serine/threonine-protein kinase